MTTPGGSPGTSSPESHETLGPRQGDLEAFLKNYYGRVVQKTGDFERDACCADSTAARFKDIVELIPLEVRERNYGCGCSIPEDDLRGLKVLDLGSGSGLDAFIVAKLVGPEGHVYGIDMTDEQLEVARRNSEPVRRAFGFEKPNTTFYKGYIETAEAINSGSIDLVISDCTINLSPLKNQVFSAAYRVLTGGGELYISDIVADRRVPERIRRDGTLVAECLGGACYEHDLYDLLEENGFRDARLVSRQLVERDPLGIPIEFYSVTLRAFKFARPLDRRCEDYGQVAIYRGTLPLSPARFALDDHHVFERNRPLAVCRNTARMLSETRLGRHFEVSEAREHFGLFPCGAPPAAASAGGVAATEGCC